MARAQLSVLIADDDPESRSVLASLLGDIEDVQVAGIVTDGAECLLAAQADEPDAVYLDVRMPKVGGLEVASALLDWDRPPAVVFVTHYDEYAFKAFEVAAIDYLVKDPDLARFAARVRESVQRVASRTARGPSAVGGADSADLAPLALRLGGPAAVGQLRKLPVRDPDEGTLRLLDPSEILCVRRCGRYVELYTSSGTYRAYYSVDRLEKRLAAFGCIRASRKALVNLEHVTHLVPNGDGSYDAILNDGAQTPIKVSRAYAQALLEALRP
ncbi:MAG: response regulator [Armatimonadia bacterium]|nr:response regulator [Armatimonadia bacterium]